MASRYWVGGTGNWNGTNTANWATTSGGGSGAAVPTAADDVFFDGSSGTGTVTIITANAVCHSFDASASSTLTLAVAGTRTWTVGGGATLTTAAVFKLGGSLTFTGGGTFTLTFDNRSGGITITTNSVVMNGIVTLKTDNNVAASATTIIADNTNVANASVVLERGSFTVNSGVTFTTTTSMTWTGSAGSKTITYSGATIVCGQWSMSGSATLTITGNSSSLLKMTGFLNGFFVGAGKSYSGTVQIEPGGGTAPISGTNTFVNLTLLGDTSFISTVNISATQTVTGVLTLTGNSQVNRLLVKATTYGTAQTIVISGATLALTNTDFQDITMSGGTGSGTSLGNLEGNTSITFTAPVTRYWIADTGNWSDITHWATTSGGSSGASMPLAQDTAIFDTNSFSTTGKTVTVDEPNVSNVDASAATNHTFTINFNSTNGTNSLFGNIVLSTQTIFSTTSGLTITTEKRSTQTFTSNSATMSISTLSGLDIMNKGGTFQPQDDFQWHLTDNSAPISINYGVLNPLGSLKCSQLGDANTADAKGFTGTSGKTLTLGGSTSSLYTLTLIHNNTINFNTMNLAITNTGSVLKLITGQLTGGVGDLTITAGGSGTVQFPGTSYQSMSLVGVGTKSIIFTSGATYTLSTPVFFNGSSGNIVTITASTGGTPFTLACTSGTINIDYISLKDSTASGAGKIPFYAGPNSTNVSGNTNWVFASAKVRGSMMELLGV